MEAARVFTAGRPWRDAGSSRYQFKTNEAVFRACTQHGVLCNVVDDPAHCDFFYPSVVRRGALQIAISTAGKSPSLARRLRKELERQFGPEYAQWVQHLGRIRSEILRQDVSPKERQTLIENLPSQAAFERFVATQLRARRTTRTSGKLDDDAAKGRGSSKR